MSTQRLVALGTTGTHTWLGLPHAPVVAGEQPWASTGGTVPIAGLQPPLSGVVVVVPQRLPLVTSRQGPVGLLMVLKNDVHDELAQLVSVTLQVPAVALQAQPLQVESASAGESAGQLAALAVISR